jgi:signal transduction histidine kinase
MITEEMFAEFDHDIRGPLTVILGEIELVLSDADVPAEERRRSVESVIGAVRQMEHMLVQWRGAAAGPAPVSL